MKYLAAAGGAAALLAMPALAAPHSNSRRTIGTTLLDDMDLFAQYSAAAYCSSNIATTGIALECNVGNCPSVEAADTNILYAFNESNDFGDTAGYLAVDTTNGYIILSFRGTTDLENWIANIDFPLKSVDSICSGCEFHQGFYDAWETVASDVTAQVNAAIADHPDYSVVVTGHSLGAALAIIAATVFRQSGIEVTMYNYGQPRVGNLATADYLTGYTSAGLNYRVTHTDDIVPKLPPEILGFDHYSPEYWITSGNDVTVTDADVNKVVGVDSTNGNDGTDGLSIEAHRWYFVYISECS